MAEIDKSLPNQVRTEVEVPSEEVDVKEEEIVEQPPVEVIPEEDGGATLNFEPGAKLYGLQNFQKRLGARVHSRFRSFRI
jgi:hypothetical protein